MEQISREQQDRLLKLMRKHRKALLAYPNARAVDIGFELKKGRPTGRLAIRVHVTDKQPEAKLKRGERLPAEIENVPVDVIQSNPVPQLVNRNAHIDPIVGGLTIGNTRATLVGTLGAVVLDRDTLEPMVLSNHHVMIVEPVSANDTIAQPRTAKAADAIGRLSRWDKNLDCAVCWVNGRTWDTGLADLPNGPNGQKAPRVGMRVTKSGRTTLVTRGVIDGTDGNEFTVIPDPMNPAPGGEISAGGDSGSVWVDPSDSAAVGLHYAGESDPAPEAERAWAKWMLSVTDKLKLTVFDGAAISQCFVGAHTMVLARTRPNAPCFLNVFYPSGRHSTAKGLGAATADAKGWVRWTWLIGSSTRRHNAGIGHEHGDPVRAVLTLDGVSRTLNRILEGNPTD